MMSKHIAIIAAAFAMTVMIDLSAAAEDHEQPAQRVDIYGDPLPEGAIARLGTVRYRLCAGAGRIEFLADGRTLLGCDAKRLVWLDVPTGRTVQAVDVEGDYGSLLAVSRDGSLAAVRTRESLQDVDATVWGLVIMDTSDGALRSRLDYRGSSAREIIKAACFVPDGTRLVSCDLSGVLRTWNVATGRQELVRTLPSPTEVNRIACSVDGKWLIACSRRAAYRWEWQTANEPLPFGRPDDRIVTIEFSPDGRTIAMGTDGDGGIRLYDVETGREIRSLTAPKRYYYPDQLAFTSDGSRIAAPSSNSLRGNHPELPGELDVWDVDSGELLHAFRFPEKLRRVAISPDDRWMAATVFEGTVSAWDLASGESVGDRFFGHVNRFGTLAVSPDGEQVATAGNEGLVVLWDARTGQPVHVLRHHPGKMVRGLAFSQDGNFIATSALDDTIVIWDRGAGERIYTLRGHGELGGQREVAFSPDSRRLLSFGDDWFLRVFDVGTGKALIEHAIRPSALPLKSNIDGSVDLVSDQRLFLSLTPESRFTSDGRTLVLAAGPDVYGFDVETGSERMRHTLDASLNGFALSYDGTRLATVVRSQAPTVQVRRLGSGEIEHTFPVPDEFSPRLAFSPNGSKLAMAGTGLRVYDIATGREIARIEPQPRVSFGLTFTPDGNRLVAPHADATALIWDWRQFLIDEEAH